MSIHVKVGGSWKEVIEPSIRPGSIGSFVVPISVHVKVGGAWKLAFEADTGPSVSPSTSQIAFTLFSAGTCYATIQFRNNGTEYQNGSATDSGHNTSRGNWLDSGSEDEVWLVRIINSGTLNRFDDGAGRLQLNTSRRFGISRTTQGTKTTNMTFQFWDAASGGNMLATVTYDLKTTLDFL